MTQVRPVAAATDAARDAIARTLALAFNDEPVFAWLFPDAARRARKLPRLFARTFDADIVNGTILAAPDACAASFWRPPGTAIPPRAEQLRRVLPMLGIFGTAIGRALALSKAIEAHLPQGEPFWYVHFVGVNPDMQGEGWGAAMMREGLARAGKTPVYLETARPRNVDFYRALGFRVTAEWDVPRGPHFWSLLHAG